MEDTSIGNVASTAGDQGTQVQSTPAEATTPDAFDLTDENRLIKIKGSDKPVKFGEHVRGFQSQFTKASQEASRLKKELEARDQKLRTYEAERTRQSQVPQNQADVFASLRQLPYLTGEHAVEVVQNIASAIQQRDQVIIALANKFQAMESQLGSLNENRSQSNFDSYINKVLTDGGYDPGLKDIAQEMYLGYEGEDLPQEFPRIFAERMDAMRKVFAAQNAAKVQAARKTPFIPGRGGQTGPTKPLEIKPNASAKEVADELWGQWAGTET